MDINDVSSKSFHFHFVCVTIRRKFCMMTTVCVLYYGISETLVRLLMNMMIGSVRFSRDMKKIASSWMSRTYLLFPLADALYMQIHGRRDENYINVCVFVRHPYMYWSQTCPSTFKYSKWQLDFIHCSLILINFNK